MRHLFVPLVLAATLSACGTGPIRPVPTGPVGPASAPALSASPVGEVIEVGAGAGAIATENTANTADTVDTADGAGRVAVGTAAGLTVLDAAGRTRDKHATTAPVTRVVAAAGGGFVALSGATLLLVPAGRTAASGPPASGPPASGPPGGGPPASAGPPVPGGPPMSAGLPAPGGGIAALPGGGAAVTLPSRGEVLIVDRAGAPVRTISTGGRPSDVAALPGDAGEPARLGVLDAERSSLTTYRLDTGAREQALQAGEGATAVIAGPDGRLVAVDTRDGELLVFSTGPLVLRQRYPAAGAPYGLAYDPVRVRLWVTLTARNQVVGYDLTGGAPREVARHATVRQPDAVAVGPAGQIYVVGRAPGVVQVISA